MMMMMGNISKRNQLSPEWGVKSRSKQTMLACILEILPCLSASQAPNSPRDTSLKPQSQNKSSYSARVTVALPKKTECEWRSSDALTDEASVSPAGSSNLDGTALGFLEGFLCPREQLYCNSLRSICVTFSSSALQCLSSESASKTLNRTSGTGSNVGLQLTLIFITTVLSL